MKPVDVERVVQELHCFLKLEGGDLQVIEEAVEAIRWLQLRVEVLERESRQKKDGGSAWVNGRCYTADQIRNGDPWV